MHSNTVLFSSLLLASGALATRSPLDVRFFNIWPAQKCSTGSFDICKNAKPDGAIKPCGDGTYCSDAKCGTWAGKSGQCCSGTPNKDTKGSIQNQLSEACTPYADALKDYSSSGGSKPITSGCSDHSKYYPTGATASDGLDVLTGNKTVGDLSCCSLDNDSVTLFSDFLQTISSSKCVSPFDKSGSSSSSGSSGGSSTTSGSSSSSSSASSKSASVMVSPSVGGAIASFMVATLAGAISMGML